MSVVTVFIVYEFLLYVLGKSAEKILRNILCPVLEQ